MQKATRTARPLAVATVGGGTLVIAALLTWISLPPFIHIRTPLFEPPVTVAIYLLLYLILVVVMIGAGAAALWGVGNTIDDLAYFGVSRREELFLPARICGYGVLVYIAVMAMIFIG